MHVIAGKAVAFQLALGEEFRRRPAADDRERGRSSPRPLAEQRRRASSRGGTDNHLMLVDVTPLGVTGKEAEHLLDEIGITVNKNAIPFDRSPPNTSSGIRVGTPAVTSRGLRAGRDARDRPADHRRDRPPRRPGRPGAPRRARSREIAGRFPVPGLAASRRRDRPMRGESPASATSSLLHRRRVPRRGRWSRSCSRRSSGGSRSASSIVDRPGPAPGQHRPDARAAAASPSRSSFIVVTRRPSSCVNGGAGVRDRSRRIDRHRPSSSRLLGGGGRWPLHRRARRLPRPPRPLAVRSARSPWPSSRSSCGITVDFIQNPFGPASIDFDGRVAVGFTVLWIVGMINSINFIDGLDGLSSGSASSPR